MKFLDQTKINVRSGNGGAGCVSFRREKYVEFGGPNGGDGGDGGSVRAEATTSLNTLIDFRYRQHFKAGIGTHGMGSHRTGAKGEDIILKLPVGTQIFDESDDHLLADMTEDGQKVLLAKGGSGGWGNARFKSATSQAPRRANPGEPGEERWLWLKLKLIADIGLIGLPNAGKSTLLSTTSAAKPKTADYPFTTLHPHLGVVEIGPGNQFVMTDLPGLIEGAADGAGLGHRFLRHAERCAALLHLVDATAENPVRNYHIVRKELQAYNKNFKDRPEIIVINKCDALDEQRINRIKLIIEKETGKTVYAVSAVSGSGVKALMAVTYTCVQEHREHKIREKRTEEMGEQVSAWQP